jgi:methylmalonyl-CoA/ethylmalonyl-CoA epimerase
MKIHHFGFLSEDIDKTVQEFINLGYKENHRVFDSERQVSIVFVESESGELIEIIEGNNENSVVKNLNKFKNNIYHICYQTENIEKEAKKLTEKGFILIDSPKPADAFDEKMVAFLYSKYVGLIELKET